MAMTQGIDRSPKTGLKGKWQACGSTPYVGQLPFYFLSAIITVTYITWIGMRGILGGGVRVNNGCGQCSKPVQGYSIYCEDCKKAVDKNSKQLMKEAKEWLKSNK